MYEELKMWIMAGVAVAALCAAVYWYCKYADERDLRLREEEMRRKIAGL